MMLMLMLHAPIKKTPFSAPPQGTYIALQYRGVHFCSTMI